MNRQERKSNYELLRIVSMFMIVLYHVIMHGHVIENTNNITLKIILYIIMLITIVHVNSFILVTGYFQCESKFKFSKVLSLCNASFFYRALVLIILISLGVMSFDTLKLFQELSYIRLWYYWFVRVYIYLYCLSPFINYLINILYKEYYGKLLLVVFIIISIIPYILGNKEFVNDGYTLYSFVFLYLLGAYFRKYPLEKQYLFKTMSKQLIQVILVFVFFACVFLNFSSVVTAYALQDVHQSFADFCHNIQAFALYYSNPFIVLQSLAFFMFFGTLNLKSKIINKLSSLTIGIYMFHDNVHMRYTIYKFLGVDKPVFSCRFVLYVFIIAILIYVVCSVIELIRQQLFKFISNRKISKKIRDKFNNWLHSIKFKTVPETS